MNQVELRKTGKFEREKKFSEVYQPCLTEYCLFDINGENHNVLVLNLSLEVALS